MLIPCLKVVVLGGLLCAMVCCSSSKGDAAEFRPELEPAVWGPWSVGSNDTKLGFKRHGDVVVVSKLQTMASKENPKPHDWAPDAPETVLPGSVEIDGKAKEIAWKYGSVSYRDGQISFKYVCGDPKLEIVSTWKSVRGSGPVEHEVVLTNNNTDTITFTPTPTIELSLEMPKNQLEHWWVDKVAGHVKDPGVHTEPITKGYSRSLHSGPYSQDDHTRDQMPWLCVQDPGGRHGLYGGVEFTGWSRITVVGSQDGELRVSLGLDPKEGRTRTRLASGKSFEYPTCFIGTYGGDVDDGCNRLRRWVESHLRPPVPGGVTPLLVNNSWGSGMAVNEELARRMIDDCAKLGIELYGVDAGWYREVGDWHTHPAKIPCGLEKISDYAHEKGLKFGLWIGWTQGGALKGSGPEALSVFNPVQKSWFGNDFPDDWKNAIFTGATVCLGSPDARKWCLDDLRRMVREYKLDMLEHDQNMVLDSCGREGHGHIPGDQVDTSRAAAEGYYSVYDQLRKENPNLFFEDCVNGGRLCDFGVLKRVHYICLSDDYDPQNLRKGFYDASHILPPSMIEMYLANHPGSTIANFRYMLRSAMTGWCTIMIDTSVWSEEQHQAAKREFETYKKRLRPLISSANLYHVFPRPDGKRWDGLQYVDPKSGSGVLYVFRPESDEETQVVKLRGLDPEKSYRVEAADGSVSNMTLSGKDLMESGLKVKLPEKKSSDLIFFQ